MDLGPDGSRVLRYTRTLELLTDTPDGGERRGGGHLVESSAGWDEEDMLMMNTKTNT